MADNIADCIEEAFNHLKNYDKEDVENYAYQLLDKARELNKEKGLGAKASISAAHEEVSNDYTKFLYDESMHQLKNLRRYQEHVDFINEGGSVLETLTRDYNNLGDNVESAQHSEMNYLYNVLTSKLAEGDLDYASENEQKILAYLDNPSGNHEKRARSVGDALDDLNKVITQRKLQTGALDVMSVNPNRFMKMRHNREKLIDAKKIVKKMDQDDLKEINPDVLDNLKDDARTLWKNYIWNKIDKYETFKLTDAVEDRIPDSQESLEDLIDEKKADYILNETYKKIVSGQSSAMAESASVRDIAAAAKKQDRFFVWKDHKSWGDYNRLYGDGSLINTIQRAASSEGKRIGLYDMYGNRPSRMYVSLIDASNRYNRMYNKKPTNRLIEDSAFDSVSGRENMNANPNISRMVDNIKMITSMSRLAKIAVLSLPDKGYQAAYIQRLGGKYWDAWGFQLKNVLAGAGTQERQDIARQFKKGLDSQIGEMARFSNIDNMSDWVKNFSNKFWRTTGMKRMDRAAKLNQMQLASYRLGELSDTAWDDLSFNDRHQLSKFLKPQEWDAIRHFAYQHDKDKMITPDVLTQMDHDDFKELRKAMDVKEKPIYEMRDDLYRRLFTYFDWASKNAVLEPGEFEKAFFYQGSNKGSVPGAIWHLFTQFKMYAATNMNRVMRHGYKDGKATGNRLRYLSALFAGTVPLAYLSNALDSISNGQTPEPVFGPNGVNYDTMASILAPSYAVFLGQFSPHQMGKDWLLHLGSSPSVDAIGDAFSTAISAGQMAAGHGDFDTVRKNFKDGLSYLLPLENVPFMSPYLNEAMGTPSYKAPGQTQLFGE